jgi:hypothetical protein
VMKKLEPVHDENPARRAALLNAQIDKLAELATEIADYCRAQKAIGGVALPDVLHEPIVAHEHLRQWHQFTSIIQLTFDKSS